MRKQGNWTKEEDQILAEIILSHVSQDSTQLKGFNEVSEQLNRTSAACAYRWNSVVRKQYLKELTEAKKSKLNKENDYKKQEEHTFDKLINQLKSLYEESLERYDSETNKEEVIGELRMENKRLNKELSYYKKKIDKVNLYLLDTE